MDWTIVQTCYNKCPSVELHSQFLTVFMCVCVIHVLVCMMCGICVCIFVWEWTHSCHCLHVESRGPSQVSVLAFCLRQTFVTMHASLTDLWVSGHFPVPRSEHLAVGALGLQTCATVLSVWVPGIWIEVLRLAWQVLLPTKPPPQS